MLRRAAPMLGLAAGLGVLLSQPVFAASPTETLQTFFAQANAIIKTVDPFKGLDEPRRAVREIVNEVIEFRGAAALALGPEWNLRRPEDQDEFVRLFANFLEKGFVAAVGSQASLSDGVKISFLGEAVVGDNASVSTTLLARNGTELPVEYWMVLRNGRWKIQDIVIDGVSLIANYRSQFNRVLTNFSYDEIIVRMRGGELSPDARLTVVARESEPALDDRQDPTEQRGRGLAHASLAGQAAVGPVSYTFGNDRQAPPVRRASLVAKAPPLPPALRAPGVPPIPMEKSVSPLALQRAGERQTREIRATASPVGTPVPSQIASVKPPAPEILRPVAAPSIGPILASLNEVPRRELFLRVLPAEPARPSTAAYWVQVGAFEGEEAALQFAEKFRDHGARVTKTWLTDASGKRVGIWARVKVGPFATRAEAVTELHDLMSRGVAAFIPEGRD